MRGQGLGAVPWEESSGIVIVAMDLDGGHGFICISQATYTSRCTYVPSSDVLWVLRMSCRDSLWACTEHHQEKPGVGCTGICVFISELQFCMATLLICK